MAQDVVVGVASDLKSSRPCTSVFFEMGTWRSLHQLQEKTTQKPEAAALQFVCICCTLILCFFPQGAFEPLFTSDVGDKYILYIYIYMYM